ncbi:MAG: 1-deoxy-D-xylulose-5-phosphate reductoisomerase [Nitrospirae bacterium]|nr:1-deoxy-D-xylulose-5-phosphate reductoisomerase [Nitrospirota bacterium]MCL5421347.1 1-deoxy-D-xylulose-5-phosphate reductoisomerase [Nitrospirota bacterium]
MKKIVILGSTGSIGRMALDVISRSRDRFSVIGLVAGKNIDLLESQVKTFQPKIVAVAGEGDAQKLRKRLGPRPEVLAGGEGINAVAAYGGADFVLSAMVGFSGLMPTLHAIRAGKAIGLANKETLVIAGTIVMEEAKGHGVVILPVDSEHSAIFQCIEGHDRRYVKRVILTASGGPFMGKTIEELKVVTPEDALKHPKWNMGKKVTIDSATLMNKGLEVIEASHLFGLEADRIDVLVHPQSIVHSMVEFSDGGLLAQISMPDMRGPIAYALSYPQRLENTVPPLELDTIGKLTFYRPDSESFPCLGFAYDALREGGTMPAVLNAANEVMVNAFLKGRISFTQIPVIIKKTMHSHKTQKAAELDAVIEADRWAREKAEEYIKKRNP